MYKERTKDKGKKDNNQRRKKNSKSHMAEGKENEKLVGDVRSQKVNKEVDPDTVDYLYRWKCTRRPQHTPITVGTPFDHELSLRSTVNDINIKTKNSPY